MAAERQRARQDDADQRRLRHWGPIDLVAEARFQQALLEPRSRIDRARAMLGRVPGDWRTQPRIDPSYTHHYSFCAPTAELTVRLTDREFTVPPQTLLWFPPGVPYELFMRSERSSEAFGRLRFQLWRGRRLWSPFTDLVQVPRAAFAIDAMHRCLVETNAPAPWRDYRLRCQLGLYTAAVLQGRGERETGPGLSAAQIQRLRDFVLGELHRRPDSRELAALAGYAPTYFTRLFRRSLGCSPRRWLLEQRIRLAADRLLDTDRPIQEVALEFGYDNPFLFSRQFSQVLGCPPRRYRQLRGK